MNPNNADQKPLYAVMGTPIVHSLSPAIHQQFAKQTNIALRYEKREILSQFEQHVIQFFNHGGNGLNVTLPYKERAYVLAAVKTPRCEEAQSANTLWMEDNHIHADNTDGIGLLRDLTRHLSLAEKSILVLGSGGAARGIIGALLSTNPRQLTVSNRTIEKALLLQQRFPQITICHTKELTDGYDVIINATALNLDNKPSFVSETSLKSHPFCYDLNYDPKHATPFVSWARSHRCTAVDGIGMLIEQAAESFSIWHGIKPDTAPLLQGQL